MLFLIWSNNICLAHWYPNFNCNGNLNCAHKAFQTWLTKWGVKVYIPEWFIEEAMGVGGCNDGLGLSAVPTTSSSESSVFDTVLLSADILAGKGCVVLSSVCLAASIACLQKGENGV